MSFNLFAAPTQDDIRVGYIDPTLGFVDGVSICEANEYAKNNPGTTFIFRDGNNNLQYLSINEVNRINPNDLLVTIDECGGIQQYKECGPPRIQFFGGDGIGAAGNPVIGRDGSLLAVDVVRGGHGYQYPPIVAAKDDCQFGNGAVLTAVLGETVDETEVFEGEEDFEEYELCEDTDVGYGKRYGPNGEELGAWEPQTYTRVGADPIQREIEIFQKALKKPFWTTREIQPDRVFTIEKSYATQDTAAVTFPEWGEFMNNYAVSPVKPSNVTGSDEAGRVFSMEWELNFPISGEYIFRGVCDNTAQVYVDGGLVGSLKGFKDNPSPLQKTIQEGNHILKVDLLNVPITEKINAPVTPNTVDVTFTITGEGRNTDKMKFSFVSGNNTFTLKGNPRGGQSTKQTIKINPNTKFVVSASSAKSGGVEQGIIKNGTKNKEGGEGESNRIFSDHIQSDNDNDDIQITTNIGTFKATNKRTTPDGRSTFNLVFEVSGTDAASSSTQIVEVISSKSWYQNPMGVSMIIDAPLPPVPQEQPPVQTGRCPPNPIWTTRFPGASQQWYPVRFPAWSKFMSRYAISPILPLSTPGSDVSGTTFSNSWQIDLPYAGFYGVKGTKDNNGRILIDGKEVSSLDGFNVDNPKISKVYLSKGRHTIVAEILNQPIETQSVIDTKIFSTQDWRTPTTQNPTAPSNLKASFIQQGSSFYLQVDGSGSGEISFSMDVDDNPFIAGIAAQEVSIPSDGSGVRLKRDPTKQKDSDKGSGTFTGGKKYGPIQIIGAGPGSRGPIVNSKNRLGIRDADGDDENIKVNIDSVKGSSAPAPQTSQSITKNGVTYDGPPLFAYNETRWSKYMNDFSVSPKVFNSISQPETPVIGKYTLTWKNVNFPYSGLYKFNFQADNVATLKVGGKEIFKTTEFAGEKVQYTFNTTPGKYDVVIELENLKSSVEKQQDFIFSRNPMGVALFISKDVVLSDSNKTPWTSNPVGISAILIPPPCAKKIGGRGVVDKVIVNDPGNGYLPPPEQGPGYPITLVLNEVIVEDPGINYRCGEDQIQITPNNGSKLSYECDSFGRIITVNVDAPGIGFNVYPEITMVSPPGGVPTGVNATFRPVFRVVRDPVQLIEEQKLNQQALIQVTDLVGLKQTGYVEGRAYYGAVYYDEGVPYAGYYKTTGPQTRVYATLQESITARVTTRPSAIQRSGTDVTSNDPRLNIPGTIEDTQT
jgi:hypothetical protein